MSGDAALIVQRVILVVSVLIFLVSIVVMALEGVIRESWERDEDE